MYLLDKYFFQRKLNRSIAKEDDCWQLGYYNREPYRFLDYLSSGLLDVYGDAEITTRVQ